jgi:hypothetical protein
MANTMLWGVRRKGGVHAEGNKMGNGKKKQKKKQMRNILRHYNQAKEEGSNEENAESEGV